MARRPAALTRAAILDAATALFSERGYAATGVRDIAAAAETDPALVIRHFGSKELLFLETMRLDLQEHPLFDAPLEELPRRLAEFVVDLDEPHRGVVVALVGARSEPRIARRLRETHEQAFVVPLLARLSGQDAELRARLAAVLVGGLVYGLWVVGDERLLASGREELVERYGALLRPLLLPV